MLPQGFLEVMDLCASVSNYGAYKAKELMESQKSLLQKRKSFEPFCCWLMNELISAVGICFYYTSSWVEMSVQLSGPFLWGQVIQLEKYPQKFLLFLI